jgi:transglutaminase-like putative cysteine protease
MTSGVTAWDQLFGQQQAPPLVEPPSRWAGLLRGADEAITFLLVYVALSAVVGSVERADWVPEMPSLSLAATVGLASGWALARTALSAWLLHVAGVVLGSVVVVGMVLRNLQLPPELAAGGLLSRWSELVARNAAWLDALRQGNVSTDPLPFVLIVVGAAWFLAYIAAWSVTRWRNPWLALVPGAISLLTNISYLPGQPSAELVAFLFASILLFARMHFLRTVEQWGSGEGATPAPPLLSLEVLYLATWVGVGLLIAAWAIPTANNWGPFSRAWEQALAPVQERVDRIGRVFAGVGSKQSLGLHQFEAVLPLQGTIVLGTNPLLEVGAAEPLYLRGAVYDEYSGSGWKQGGTSERALTGTTVEAASFGTPQTRAQLRQPVPAAVLVDEPIARRRLFTFGEPVAADEAARLVIGGAPEDIVGLAPASGVVQRADRYQTVGTISAATVDRLRTSSIDYPAWVRARYLQLPADLPAPIRQLAGQIASGERVPYNVATKMQDYLRFNYTYSLEMGPRPPRTDAVSHFLFETKQGYSDYFASAMAIMLRAQGIPSRVVVGFALDSTALDPATKQFRVTDQASWVWTQVYFTGYGWVDFNPSPLRPAIARPGDDTEVAAAAAADAAAGATAGDVPDEEADIPRVSDEELAAAERAAFTARVTRIVTVVLGASVLVLVAIVGTRLTWDAAFRRLPPATRRWAKTQTLAAFAGIRMYPAQTPLEEAAALGAAITRPPLDLRPLASAYAAERYGGKRIEESPEASKRMEELYAAARGRLTRRLMRRLWPFGRRRD